MRRFISDLLFVGFFGALLASLVSISQGHDVRALYFLALSAYCMWSSHELR